MKKVIVIGAGLSGLTLANQLLKNNVCNIVVLEKGLKKTPFNDESFYKINKPNLNFTRAKGEGGTSNYWHSGLIRMPKESSWTESMLYESGWYDKAIELTGCRFFNNLNKNNKDYEFDYIYYPFKRFRAAPDKGLEIKFDVKNIKINPKINSIEFSSQDIDLSLDYDFLILAAGGIGTPLILKNQNNSHNFNQEICGKNLTDHTSSNPMRVKLKNFSLINFSYLTTSGILRKGYKYKDPVSGLNHIIYVRPAMSMKLSGHTQSLKRLMIGFWGEKNKIKTLLKLLSSIDILLEVIANKIPAPIFTKYLSVSVVSEQQEVNSNFIDLNNDSVEINWTFNNEERASVISACYWFLKNSGFQIKDFNISTKENIEYTSSCHHSGTARFGSEASTSLVDKNLKFHEYNNIYICDGSVLPNTSYANTGLTIIALSLRLANHIRLRISKI
jgi:choline dehydrogenase-like flavoprotein